MNTAVKQQPEPAAHRKLFEDAEFSKTVLVVATAIGSALLLAVAVFANIALK